MPVYVRTMSCPDNHTRKHNKATTMAMKICRLRGRRLLNEHPPWQTLLPLRNLFEAAAPLNLVLLGQMTYMTHLHLHIHTQ